MRVVGKSRLERAGEILGRITFALVIVELLLRTAVPSAANTMGVLVVTPVAFAAALVCFTVTTKLAAKRLRQR
jgi:hypothetical protein